MTGTTLSGWEIEDLIATENSRIWEELNSSEPEDGPQCNLYSVLDEINDSLDFLYNAINSLRNAVDDAKEHPIVDKLIPVLDMLRENDKTLTAIEQEISGEIGG